MYERTLRRVRVNPQTVLLVLLPSLGDMRFLRLLHLELLLDLGLELFSVLGLSRDECGGGGFEFIFDLLGELEMKTGLFVRLGSQCFEGVSEFTVWELCVVSGVDLTGYGTRQNQHDGLRKRFGHQWQVEIQWW